MSLEKIMWQLFFTKETGNDRGNLIDLIIKMFI